MKGSTIFLMVQKSLLALASFGGDGGWASLSQNADAMYQHAYGVRNPMHGTLNIQVSNSASQVGTQISFLRASA